EVYRTVGEKNNAIVDLIEDCHKLKQPVLVGTVSIEKSEQLAGLLKKRKIPHHVLNAPYHEQEAFIIAQAGAPGGVTIATNMAGRGTDIQLGGNLDMRIAQEAPEDMPADQREKKIAEIKADIEAKRKIVLEAGGLYVVGTERHESRRIDNQLRGRSGRQGDPGGSKFFLSLEDDLMRIFGSERIDGMLKKLGLEEGEAIMHPWVNKALEKAQEKVEERNFEIRKNLLKFDDVMNDQRKVIYEQRKEMMTSDDVSQDLKDMRHQVIDDLVASYIPEKALPEQWNVSALHGEILRIFGLDLPIAEWAKEEGIADAEIHERIEDLTNRQYAEKVANYGAELMRNVEKSVLLQVLDQTWKEHLLTLDHLRQGIGLRAYGQRDPLNEYKSEAFEMFSTMLENLRERTTMTLAHIEFEFENEDALSFAHPHQQMIETRDDPAFQFLEGESDDGTAFAQGGDVATVTPVRSRNAAAEIDPNDPETWGRVSRNAPCPCGSGKKYKHCHGKMG
ncbi:MAG: SEC-C metal-binding domain-containing protein, partial [Rhodospirillales bacterium]